MFDLISQSSPCPCAGDIFIPIPAVGAAEGIVLDFDPLSISCNLGSVSTLSKKLSAAPGLGTVDGFGSLPSEETPPGAS